MIITVILSYIFNFHLNVREEKMKEESEKIKKIFQEHTNEMKILRQARQDTYGLQNSLPTFSLSSPQQRKTRKLRKK